MITWDQAIGEPGLWLGWTEGQDTRFDEPTYIVKEVPEGGAWAGWQLVIVDRHCITHDHPTASAAREEVDWVHLLRFQAG